MSRPAALVTGGARRIGEAIVRRFAAEGWHVVVHCHTSAEQGAALAKEGEMVECPACKAKAKVGVREGHAVEWVDPKGKETMFMVKPAGEK